MIVRKTEMNFLIFKKNLTEMNQLIKITKY